MEKLHIQPTELDMLPYYEYEYTISIYNDLIKDRKSDEDQSYAKESDKYNINGMQGQMKRNMGSMKTPSMPSIKIPKM
jgi:hypothetical protein